MGGARHIVVTGNRIGNPHGNDAQSYGIVETADCAMGAYKLLGTGTIVKDNLGVREEQGSGDPG